MVWWCWAMVVVGAALAARAAWVGRRTESTGAHGMVVAAGVGLVFWGVLLGVVVGRH